MFGVPRLHSLHRGSPGMNLKCSSEPYTRNRSAYRCKRRQLAGCNCRDRGTTHPGLSDTLVLWPRQKISHPRSSRGLTPSADLSRVRGSLQPPQIEWARGDDLRAMAKPEWARLKELKHAPVGRVRQAITIVGIFGGSMLELALA